MMTGTHPSLSGLLAGALLLFNGAPRCIPTANLLLNISNLLDADHIDQDKPRSRVHCEEAKTQGRGKPDVGAESPAGEDDCRCVVVAASVA